MPHGFGHVSIVFEPLGGAAVDFNYACFAKPATEFLLQVLCKEVMIAIGRIVALGPYDKGIERLKTAEQLFTSALTPDRIGETGAEPLHDGREAEEFLQFVGEPAYNLLGKIGGDVSAVAMKFVKMPFRWGIRDDHPMQKPAIALSPKRSPWLIGQATSGSPRVCSSMPRHGG